MSEPTTLPEGEIQDVEGIDADAVAETPETPQKPQKTWAENFNVKEQETIETVDRLKIVVGINEYKGSHLVFMAKVTDKEFSRQFFSLPAYVWEKAIPILQKHLPKIAEVEKQTMKESVAKELQRLKELGIDINELVAQVK
jgi:hypothetical protein